MLSQKLFAAFNNNDPSQHRQADEQANQAPTRFNLEDSGPRSDNSTSAISTSASSAGNITGVDPMVAYHLRTTLNQAHGGDFDQRAAKPKREPKTVMPRRMAPRSQDDESLSAVSSCSSFSAATHTSNASFYSNASSFHQTKGEMAYRLAAALQNPSMDGPALVKEPQKHKSRKARMPQVVAPPPKSIIPLREPENRENRADDLDSESSFSDKYAASESSFTGSLISCRSQATNRSIESSASTKPERFSKTQMCKFIALGWCRRGPACPYAHSEEELKSLPDLYCTQLCKALFTQGRCDNPNCNFAHSKDELRASEAAYKTKLCRYWQAGACKLGAKCRFAHSEVDMRSGAGDNAASTQDAQGPDQQFIQQMPFRSSSMPMIPTTGIGQPQPGQCDIPPASRNRSHQKLLKNKIKKDQESSSESDLDKDIPQTSPQTYCLSKDVQRPGNRGYPGPSSPAQSSNFNPAQSSNFSQRNPPTLTAQFLTAQSSNFNPAQSSNPAQFGSNRSQSSNFNPAQASNPAQFGSNRSQSSNISQHSNPVQLSNLSQVNLSRMLAQSKADFSDSEYDPDTLQGTPRSSDEDQKEEPQRQHQQQQQQQQQQHRKPSKGTSSGSDAGTDGGDSVGMNSIGSSIRSQRRWADMMEEQSSDSNLDDNLDDSATPPASPGSRSSPWQDHGTQSFENRHVSL